MSSSLQKDPVRGALCDAHNHLQDERFGGRQEQLVREAVSMGVECMVVNGSCEEDWPQVAELARRFPCVLPSFGYHPWYVRERSSSWIEQLSKSLEVPGAAVGEIGLDRWKEGLDWADQESVFIAQWRMAVDRGLPISVHCLKAWGPLEEILRREPPAPRGFLLHSYGGSPEMILPLLRLGAYFSFPGYFLNDRKLRQAETFQKVPRDRLLVETDAPDQLPPTSLIEFPLTNEASADAINHPANLAAIYKGLAGVLGYCMEELVSQTRQNFRQLFNR